MTGKYVTIGLLVLVVVLLVVACTSPTIDTFVTSNTNFNNGAFIPNSSVPTHQIIPLVTPTTPTLPTVPATPSPRANEPTRLNDINYTQAMEVLRPALQQYNNNVSQPAMQAYSQNYQQTTNTLQTAYNYPLNTNPHTTLRNSNTPAKIHLSNLNAMIQEASKTTGKLAGQTHMISHMFLPIMHKAYQESRTALQQKHSEMVQECLDALGCTKQYEPNKAQLEQIMSKKLEEMMNEIVLPMFSATSS